MNKHASDPANRPDAPPVRSPSSRISRLAWRLYEELLQPSRLDDYRRLLQNALDAGYEVIDNEQWLHRLRAGQIGPQQKVLVMRHDIDTDPRLSLDWHRIESELGCRASYYFRQSTRDAEVMHILAKAGVHVSYHFEELAEYAKQNRLRSPAAVQEAMPEIQAQFVENLHELRREFGLPMNVVCSHGDWMNRYLKMPNRVLTHDDGLRTRAGIISETYDDEVMMPFAAYVSDDDPPAYWARGNPFELIQQGTSPLGILTHPKLWRSHWSSNARELTVRIREALQFKFGKGWK